MFISELFYSVQGEGSLLGVPSVFIRTSGCNLRCSWCDTPYTSWKPEGQHLSLDQILDYTRQNSTGYTVVTGGEPMMAPDIVQLTQALRDLNQHITIETAGTIDAPVACDLMSISPKLSNSTPEGDWRERHERTRLSVETLGRLTTEFEYQLKFVVSRPEDLEEIVDLAKKVSAPPHRVILMPEGTDDKTLSDRGLWVSELCKQHGFRFSPRLHVHLYGNRRGV